MIYDWAKGFNMTSTDEDISILNELGLTFSQAKIYQIAYPRKK
jgi:hypothetical protein